MRSRKNVLFTLGISFGLLLGMSVQARAATYYVRTMQQGGNDSTGTGTLAKPWRTVKKGTDKALNGDTVDVGEGTFDVGATCNLRTGVTLTGAGRDLTTIRGTSAIPLSNFHPNPDPNQNYLNTTIIRLLRVANSGPTVIKKLTLDGLGMESAVTATNPSVKPISDRGHMAIYAPFAVAGNQQITTSVEIFDFRLTNFRFGVNLEACSNASVHDFVTENAGLNGLHAVYNGGVNGKSVNRFWVYNGVSNWTGDVYPGQITGSGAYGVEGWQGTEGNVNDLNF
jgi:hypothetical protein